jgi:hypothetical protein
MPSAPLLTRLAITIRRDETGAATTWVSCGRSPSKGVVVLEWAGKGWLERAGGRGVALGTVRAHIAAEVDTRTDVIMSTVSADPWFPLPERLPEGLELTVADGTLEVTSYYANRADGYVVLASNQLKQLVADWYVFNESAATLRQTGAIGDVTGGDAEFVVNSAVLFPTASDGIRGEIAVTRYPFADIIEDRVPVRSAPTGPLAYLPVDELEHSVLLDRLLDGLRAGDVRDLLTDDHGLAVRVDSPDAPARCVCHTGDESAAALVELFAGARDLTVLGRITSEWYVFAEYLAVFEGKLRRLVAIHPVRDGRLEGTFGYGLDEIGADGEAVS